MVFASRHGNDEFAGRKRDGVWLLIKRHNSRCYGRNCAFSSGEDMDMEGFVPRGADEHLARGIVDDVIHSSIMLRDDSLLPS